MAHDHLGLDLSRRLKHHADYNRTDAPVRPTDTDMASDSTSENRHNAEEDGAKRCLFEYLLIYLTVFCWRIPGTKPPFSGYC